MVEQRRAALDGTQVHIASLKAIVPMLARTRFGILSALAEDLRGQTAIPRRREGISSRKSKNSPPRNTNACRTARPWRRRRSSLTPCCAEFKRTRLTELAAAETRAASLAREVAKAGKRTHQQRLTAPIDGTVQQLAVHTLGGVVTPAQQLLVIAPQNQPLEVEAWVENKDIGFVRVGQAAEVKVAAFPFTRYGTLPAQVVTLSHDAVPLEQGGLAYAARVSLERTTILVDGAQVPLSPGMAVTVEIKTGTRRLLEYFFSPLVQAGQESARER